MIMSRKPVFAAALAAVSLTACSSLPRTDETVVAAAPFAIDVHKGDFTEIQQFTTPGGASVWLVSEPSIPMLSVQMAWKGGEAADPAGLEGLASAAVYHMNEGAGDLDSLAFQTAMEDLNMSFGCDAGNDWTSCSASMLTENMGDAMDLVALALTSPRFDAGPFERFQRENEVSLKTRETNAGYLLARAQAAAFYKDHPYAREMSAASLAKLTPENAKAHARQLMTKDRLIVTAVGAVSPAELAPMIDKAIAGLAATSTLPATPQITLPANGAASARTIDLPQPQSLVAFTGKGLKFEDADFFPATVLNYTFGGGGFDSRLMKSLREEKGLTYGIYSGINDGDYLQTWGGSGQTKNESAGEFLTGIKAEMTAMAERGVTAEELADAKAYLMGSYPLSFDSNAKIAGQMMGVRQRNRGVDYFDRRNGLIDAVTLDQVNRVAKTYLDPARFSYFVVGQPQGLPAVAPVSTPVTTPAAGPQRTVTRTIVTPATPK
jgi:zinc protease